MPKIKITALYVYPVKSLAGVKVNHLKFDRFGPEFDRRWMIVDECGNCLTQREITKMALIKVNFDAEYLYLSYADQMFKLELCAAKLPIMAQVWKHRGEMLDCGDSV
ncbi:MAG: MOSC domain-containing protein, partial [Burkholderiales bacterium]|nr:MOSC domain-containing protein [Burkholderiales bacterium]